MSDKKISRLRRARQTRFKIRELGAIRLCVYRSNQHIYAQIVSADGSKILASASSLDESLRSGSTGNAETAKKVGQLIAERAKTVGVSRIAFDRSGFQYHGRIKVLAEAARENGLEF